MKNRTIKTRPKAVKSAIERLRKSTPIDCMWGDDLDNSDHDSADLGGDLDSDLTFDLDDLDDLDAPAPSSVKSRNAKAKRLNKRPIGQLAKRRAKKRKAQLAKKAKTAQPSLPDLGMADASPALDDKDAKGLWACDTVEKVEAYIEKGNRSFKKKVLAATDRSRIDDTLVSALKGLFDGTATSSPIMTNDGLRHDAWHHLYRELVALKEADDEIEVVLVTIIAGTGGTSHVKPTIDLRSEQAAAQSTLRAMSPDFFAITELAMFNSTGHADGGQLLQAHTHALVIGRGALARARAVAAKHMNRFAPNATGAPQIDVRSVNTDPVNMARICAYLFKAPSRNMTWCPPRDGKKGFMHQSEKGDRNIRYLRMALIRAMLTVEDVTFGGGDGQRIRSQMIKVLRPKCVADAPPHRRLLHPDAIGAFTVDVAKALKKEAWSLPIIARQR